MLTDGTGVVGFPGDEKREFPVRFHGRVTHPCPDFPGKKNRRPLKGFVHRKGRVEQVPGNTGNKRERRTTSSVFDSPERHFTVLDCIRRNTSPFLYKYNNMWTLEIQVFQVKNNMWTR